MPDGGVSEALLLSMLTGAEFAPAAAGAAAGAGALGATAAPTLGAALAGDLTAESMLPALSGYGSLPSAAGTAAQAVGGGINGMGGIGAMGDYLATPMMKGMLDPSLAYAAMPTEAGGMLGAASSGLPSWMTLGNAKDALGAAAAGKALVHEPDQPIVPGQMPQRPQPQNVFPNISQVLDQTALQELRRKRRGLL